MRQSIYACQAIVYRTSAFTASRDGIQFIDLFLQLYFGKLSLQLYLYQSYQLLGLGSRGRSAL